MCIYAWRTSWLSGADLGRLRDCSIAMGKAHLLLPPAPKRQRREGGEVPGSYVYSDLVGYQTSDMRLLWTIITRP